MFFAEKDNGAFFNNHRMKVSNRNNIDECLFVIMKHQNELNFPNRKTGCAT